MIDQYENEGFLEENMKRSEFYLGMEFFMSGVRYVCVDGGRRTIVGMRLPLDEGLAQDTDFDRHLFLLDAYDMEGCERNFADSIDDDDPPSIPPASTCKVSFSKLHEPLQVCGSLHPAKVVMRQKAVARYALLYSANRLWRCTDLGQYGFMAIEVESLDPAWERVSPFTVAEFYFGYDLLQYFVADEEQAIAQWGFEMKEAIQNAKNTPYDAET